VTADLSERVAHWLDRNAPPGPLAIACSGGSDSLALLHLASAWARRAGRRLDVLTVDHGLRAESAAETRFVAEQARALGHEAVRLVWTGDKPATGLQEAARQARHRLLTASCEARGATALLLAHTLDDQAETVWMRLAAGGGWRGAGGMRAVSASPLWPEGRGIRLLRPLLDTRRGALRDWLGTQGLDWAEDPSNADSRYTRVRVRGKLAALEAAGFRPERLAALAGELAALREAEARAAGRLAGEAVEMRAWGGMILQPEPFRDAASGIRLALMEAAALAVSGAARLPGRAALVRLQEALLDGRRATAAGVMLAPWRGRTWLVRDPGAVLGRVDRAGTGALSADGVWDGRFAVTGLRPGFTAGALGRSYDGLDDRAILDPVPGFARSGLLALRQGDRVRAVAGCPGPDGKEKAGSVQIEALQAHRFCTWLLPAARPVWFDTK